MLPKTDTLEGKWHQLRGLIKEKWGEVTDDDLDKIRGRSEQLAGLLQEKYGFSRRKAEAELASLREQAEEWQDKAHDAAQTVADIAQMVADRLERRRKRSRLRTAVMLLLGVGLVAVAWRWFQPFLKVNAEQFSGVSTYQSQRQ
ncbi:MAG TPA: CsbD family protein [Anaerolineae bacterium]